MNKISLLLISGLLVILLAGFAGATPAAGVSFGLFYSNLSGYGEWIDIDGGTYAWRPSSIGVDWRPYWAGRWLWTDDGWYWDSDEPWAWATYHYGRWYNDDYYGWIWIPGYDWAPAWVEWRYGGDYIGWAPLSPYAIFNMNFGIHYMRHWVTPYHYWAFVDCRYLTHSHVHEYVYRTENNTRFIGRTRTGGSVRFDNGRIVTRGPNVAQVENRGNIRIDRTPMVDVNGRDDARLRRVGDRDQLGVYRPRIEERGGDLAVERPPVTARQERVPSLDTRSLDVRQRQSGREEGRVLERANANRRRSEEKQWNSEQPAVRDYRVPDRNRETPTERSTPAERPRRFNRESERMWDGGTPNRDSGTKATPNVDRPSSRSGQGSGWSTPRSERSGGERSAPSRRSGGEGRGRR
jgi:hypothetical protein